MNYDWIVQFKETIISSEITSGKAAIKVDYSNRNKNATRAYSAGSIDQSVT